MKNLIIKSTFALVIINLILWIIRIISGSEYIQVQFLPDDAYYYLTLARNFALSGEWTFDSGQTITTGFHILYAYFLVVMHKINIIGNYVNFSVITSFIFILLLLSIIYGLYRRHQNNTILLTAALFISSMNFTYNSFSVVEWNPVVLISALYFCIMYGNYLKKPVKKNLILSTLGFLGCLARVEFILTVFCLFLGSMLIHLFNKNNQNKHLLLSLIPLAGSFLGIFVVFGHNYYFSGEIFQSSARVKYFWSQSIGYNFIPFLYNCLRIFIPIPRLYTDPFLKDIIYRFILFIFPIIVLLPAIIWRNKIIFIIRNISFMNINPNLVKVFIGCMLTVLSYILFYGFNSQGIQSWYSATVIVPLSILAYIIIAKIISKKEIAVKVILLLLIALNISITWIAEPLYKGQEIKAAKGKFVAKNLQNTNIAAWDSGIIGYFSGGRILNLDGLVNNEIGPYIIGDSVSSYILKKDIEYLIQTPHETLRMQKLLGFSDGIINKCLIEQTKVFEGRTFILYEIDKIKLNRMILEKYLTIEEVCDILKVKKHYIYALTSQRKIPFIKVGRFLRFEKGKLEKWLQDQAQEPVDINSITAFIE